MTDIPDGFQRNAGTRQGCLRDNLTVVGGEIASNAHFMQLPDLRPQLPASPVGKPKAVVVRQIFRDARKTRVSKTERHEFRTIRGELQPLFAN